MYPAGGFPVPVGSFTEPVDPPGVDPTAGPLVYVGINCAWLPYITGALTQLLLQSTWNFSTLAELENVRGQATDLMNLFNCARLPSLEDLLGTQGSGCEEDCMCCLRFQDGKLQSLVCGVWTDVPGQEGGIIPASPQPGDGTPQPKPGECKKYHGQLPATEQWYLPTVVNSGDVITASNFGGASNAPPAITWNCPTGLLFFAGQCQGDGLVADFLGPLSTAFTQALIIEINGSFYDLTQGPFTVPGGVVNETCTVQLNWNDLSELQGNVTFDIEVCNNVPADWTHEFNFQLGPQGWAVRDEGDWTPSVGFVDGQVIYTGTYYRGADINRLGADPYTLTRIQAFGSCTTGIAPLTFGVGASTPGSYIAQITPVTGDLYVDTGPISIASVTDLYCDLIVSHQVGSDGGGTALITKIIVSGQGTDPYLGV